MQNARGYANEQEKFQLKYDKGPHLTGGHYSSIHKGVQRQTKKPVIITTLFQQPVSVPDEVRILRKLTNVTGIVQLIDHYRVAIDTHCVIMEYFPSMTLRAYIATFGRLTEMQTKKVVCQLISTIQSCSRLRILHRNIKPNNILIDRNSFNIKLTNFGSACFVGKEPLNSKVFHAIAPPEY